MVPATIADCVSDCCVRTGTATGDATAGVGNGLTCIKDDTVTVGEPAPTKEDVELEAADTLLANGGSGAEPPPDELIVLSVLEITVEE